MEVPLGWRCEVIERKMQISQIYSWLFSFIWSRVILICVDSLLTIEKALFSYLLVILYTYLSR